MRELVNRKSRIPPCFHAWLPSRHRQDRRNPHTFALTGAGALAWPLLNAHCVARSNQPGIPGNTRLYRLESASRAFCPASERLRHRHALLHNQATSHLTLPALCIFPSAGLPLCPLRFPNIRGTDAIIGPCRSIDVGPAKEVLAIMVDRLSTPGLAIEIVCMFSRRACESGTSITIARRSDEI